MRNKLLIAGLLATTLVGCGVGGDDDWESCHTWYSYDQEIYFEDGLVLEPSAMYITAQQVDQFFQEVQACMGASGITGPRVKFLNFRENGMFGGAGLYTFADGGRVYINTDESFAELDCNRNRQDLKHELVHHVLYMTGADWETVNQNHNSPYFGTCTQ